MQIKSGLGSGRQQAPGAKCSQQFGHPFLDRLAVVVQVDFRLLRRLVGVITSYSIHYTKLYEFLEEFVLKIFS